MWLFAFKRFKIEKSLITDVDFGVNILTHWFKTNFYFLTIKLIDEIWAQPMR